MNCAPCHLPQPCRWTCQHISGISYRAAGHREQLHRAHNAFNTDIPARKAASPPVRPVRRTSVVAAHSWRKANWEDTAALVLVTALSIAAALAFAALSKSPSWTGGRTELDKQAPTLQDSVNKLRATVASDEATIAGLKKVIARDEARISSLEFQLTALESFLAIGGVLLLVSRVTGSLFSRGKGSSQAREGEGSNGASWKAGTDTADTQSRQ
eukprot:jgi/Ulvmu1/2829/UM142_0027.1